MDHVVPTSGSGHGFPIAGTGIAAMRSDLTSMLLPFFPEDRGLTRYRTEIGGYIVDLSCDEGYTIATASDRKVLNCIGAAIAGAIRAGREPSRHVEMEVRPMLEALSPDAVMGGADYQRIRERLTRLMATVIETEMPIADDVRRRRRFRWIDAFEHDDKITPNGRKILSLRISLSEDAFRWMTTSLGFDISTRDFQAITSARSSIWRIYEICLATLARAETRTTCISIDELRSRIPISSELKVFKSRTLRAALEAIEQTPEMSARITARLERKTEKGFTPIDFSKRAPLDSLYVRVGPGTSPLPSLNRLLPPGSLPEPAPVPYEEPDSHEADADADEIATDAPAEPVAGARIVPEAGQARGGDPRRRRAGDDRMPPPDVQAQQIEICFGPAVDEHETTAPHGAEMEGSTMS